MKSGGLLVGLVVIAIIGYGAYYYYHQIYEQTLAEIKTNPQIVVPPIPYVSPIASESAIASASAIPSDWKSYTSQKHRYVIRYPEKIKFDESSEGDRFYYLGSTQSMGTELYDGISLLLTSQPLMDNGLAQVAQKQHDRIAAEPTTNAITPVKSVSFGVHKGFQFRVSSLGEADYTYLIMPNARVLQIVNLTVVPPSSDADYHQIVEQMISSIRFQ